MLDSPQAQRTLNDQDRRDDRPFAASHRALSVGGRPLASRMADVTMGVAGLHAACDTEVPLQRPTPGRGVERLRVADVDSRTDTLPERRAHG